jgi:hypothetical protein
MTNQDIRPKTAAERQEELISQLVRLASSVEDLARRTPAAGPSRTEQTEPPPVGVSRVQFSYALLGELLGRTAPGFSVPRLAVRRGVDGNQATLTFDEMLGGAAIRVRARDGTVRTLDAEAGKVIKTGIPSATPIDTIVVLRATDGVPLAIASCPTVGVD